MTTQTYADGDGAAMQDGVTAAGVAKGRRPWRVRLLRAAVVAAVTSVLCLTLWSVDSLYRGVRSPQGSTVSRMVTVSVGQCWQVGPVSRYGWGYRWSCDVSYLGADGLPASAVVNRSVVEPRDGGTVTLEQVCPRYGRWSPCSLGRPGQPWGSGLLRVFGIAGWFCAILGGVAVATELGGRSLREWMADNEASRSGMRGPNGLRSGGPGVGLPLPPGVSAEVLQWRRFPVGTARIRANRRRRLRAAVAYLGWVVLVLVPALTVAHGAAAVGGPLGALLLVAGVAWGVLGSAVVAAWADRLGGPILDQDTAVTGHLLLCRFGSPPNGEPSVGVDLHAGTVSVLAQGRRRRRVWMLAVDVGERSRTRPRLLLSDPLSGWLRPAEDLDELADVLCGSPHERDRAAGATVAGLADTARAQDPAGTSDPGWEPYELPVTVVSTGAAFVRAVGLLLVPTAFTAALGWVLQLPAERTDAVVGSTVIVGLALAATVSVLGLAPYALWRAWCFLRAAVGSLRRR